MESIGRVILNYRFEIIGNETINTPIELCAGGNLLVDFPMLAAALDANKQNNSFIRHISSDTLVKVTIGDDGNSPGLVLQFISTTPYYYINTLDSPGAQFRVKLQGGFFNEEDWDLTKISHQVFAQLNRNVD